MNVTSAKEITVYRVSTDETDYHDYTRYGPDSWTVTMGESEEQVYWCSELESAFQAFLASNASVPA